MCVVWYVWVRAVCVHASVHGSVCVPGRDRDSAGVLTGNPYDYV